MAYNAGIPISTDLLSQSQPQILGNFMSIGAFMSPDNGEFLTGILLDVNAPVAPAANQVGLYVANGSKSGTPELWYVPYLGSVLPNTAVPVAFTESMQVSQSAGYTRLPSGVLLKWGTQTGIVPNTPGQYVTFPTGANIPAFTNIFSVQVTAIGTAGNTGSIWSTSFTTAQILVWSTGMGLTACNWFAIGN